MPTTRRKNPSSNSRAQPKLAFNARSNKITKPSVAAPSKSLKTEGTAADKLSDATTDDIHVSSVPQIPDDVDLQTEEQNTASELVIRPQVLAESEKRTESEERAARITDAQLKVYWKSKEDERKAPRGTLSTIHLVSNYVTVTELHELMLMNIWYLHSPPAGYRHA